MQEIYLPFLSLSSFLDLAEAAADWHGTALLYSGGSLDSAQHTFLALFPYESVTLFSHKLDYQIGNCRKCFEVEDPWEGLQDHFFCRLEENVASMAFGWLGYGMGAFADKERKLPYRSSGEPDAYWQRCAVVFSFDHSKKMASVQIDSASLKHLEQMALLWIEALTSNTDKREKFLSQFVLAPKAFTVPSSPLPFVDSTKRQLHYLNQISSVQNLIRDGEVYQVNLSQQFDFQSTRHPFSIFRQICLTNPAPFSAYFRHENRAIVSSSPERFLCKKGAALETRPMKGTIQRGRTQEEDLELKEKLLSSPKERAELLMITDLMRNDLGKISIAGSVKTDEIWRCETYTNVFHLISVIRSIAKNGLKPLEFVRECFPGGSITGCPKLRAMEIIDALENRPRGIYTGTIGYFTGKGDFDLNIAIRTLAVVGNLFSLQLGGGIVIDSNPEQEYRETIYKGASFFHLLQSERSNTGTLCD